MVFQGSPQPAHEKSRARCNQQDNHLFTLEKKKKMIVLVDIDNTIGSWDDAFLARMECCDAKRVTERGCFRIEDVPWSEPERSQMISVLQDPTLYRDIALYDHAKEALEAMRSSGYDVFLVSSPHEQCRGPCAKYKLEWVTHRLGEYWAKRTILTNDKTMVRGDVLIDDKPTIAGATKPAFRHVVFDQPYNRSVPTFRLRAWQDWQEVLALF